MSRTAFSVEKSIRIFKENSDTNFIDFIFGAGAPPGTAGETDAASIGSQYNDTTNGAQFKKIADTSSASDWEEIGNVSIDELRWRNELVRAATVDTVSVGIVDPTGFSDNESGLDGNDFSVGEFLLGDVDGVPALFEVTVVTGVSSITVAAAALPIVSNDTFIVQVYLPDSPGSQELQAIIHIPVAGSPSVKIGDINWNFADGINMAAGYSAQNGTVSSSDTVNSAIEKLDGNQADIQTTSGVAQGAVHNGSMNTGDILSDNATTNALLKETDAELTRQRGKSNVNGVTAEATIDEVLVDNVSAVTWQITIEDATGSAANKKHMDVFAGHNGHSGADATSVDESISKILKLGSNFNVEVIVDLNGAAGSQTMRLRVTSSEGSGVNVYAKRIETLF